ncbi:phosphatidate cytidylyltransferase [Mycoplasmopsis californica]|nr:phosphatidate cytidylyltransferase [Mycoplasmopsis californica]BBG42339.1 phosphatidate cytidylyltransferase [Mycoplasmopsis californica]
MNKFLVKRIMPGILFVVILLAMLIPLSIFSHSNLVARIFSFVFIWTILSMIAWEFFTAQRLKIYWSITLTFLFSIVAFLPLIETTIPWMTSPKIEQEKSSILLARFISYLSMDPFIILVALAISILFVIIELFTRTNTRPVDRFTRFLLAFIITYILAIFSKVFHALIVFEGQWKYWLSISLIAASVDTFGYLFGSMFGKKWTSVPFAPHISPRKTWEGFVGSIFIGTATGFGLVFAFDLFNHISLKIAFALISPFVAVIGDLYFSAIKRLNGIKDYSKIMLGHGGILDRLDSISFVCVFTYIILLINTIFVV